MTTCSNAAFGLSPLPDIPVHRPASLEEALRLLSDDPSSRILAGGTDLVVDLRSGRLEATSLVDIGEIGELSRIEELKGTLVIGGGVLIAEVASNPTVKRMFPALSLSAATIGSVQIRNLATLGGNIATASPCADTVVPLVCADAVVRTASTDGERDVPLESFATGPRTNCLRSGEMIVSISVPEPGLARRVAVGRLGTRSAMSISKVTAAMGVSVKNDYLRDVRVVLGAVAPTVIRARKTEGILSDCMVADKDRIERAVEMVQKEARPISDLRSTTDYRRRMCGVLLRRCVRDIIGG
jgi:CO/xanthine dehydrogenase FAD-binding subunit